MNKDDEEACICVGSCVCGFTHDIIFADDLDTEPDTIDSLRQEIARLTADRDDWRNICSEQTLRAEQAEQRVAKYEKALKEISTMGRVCEGFELCTHVACADSCGSTLIALEALNL